MKELNSSDLQTERNPLDERSICQVDTSLRLKVERRCQSNTLTSSSKLPTEAWKRVSRARGRELKFFSSSSTNLSSKSTTNAVVEEHYECCRVAKNQTQSHQKKRQKICESIADHRNERAKRVPRMETTKNMDTPNKLLISTVRGILDGEYRHPIKDAQKGGLEGSGDILMVKDADLRQKRKCEQPNTKPRSIRHVATRFTGNSNLLPLSRCLIVEYNDMRNKRSGQEYDRNRTMRLVLLSEK